MSATATFSTPTTTLIGTSSAMATVATGTETPCPVCGGMSDVHDSSEAQRRIQELEGQVQELTERATDAANKLATYEEEVRQLRSSQGNYDTPRSSSSLPPSRSQESDRAVSPTQAPGSLSPNSANSNSNTPIKARKPQPPQTTVPINPLAQQASPASASIFSDNAELQDALTREQDLRRAAESQLAQSNTELEELTVQLFSQANEMVAQERKARAKLEERVAVLERRDIEKRSRLERLEKSMARVERLKALVNP
ncbi:GDPGTP exchange factor Sec2p [Penicillium chermesinum]|nr:GDPGTP exchange factor Sec2p [Penicillium chermesinum]